MPQPPADADPRSWHRHFAMEANNRAWSLAEEGDATRHRDLLDTAHAAAWHWATVGNELNDMRARMLLAHAHALARHGATALAYADEVRRYFTGKETPDWELAFAHAIYAHAAHAAGQSDAYRTAYAQAVAAVAAIADEEDRAIVQKTFRQVPAP